MRNFLDIHNDTFQRKRYRSIAEFYNVAVTVIHPRVGSGYETRVFTTVKLSIRPNYTNKSPAANCFISFKSNTHAITYNSVNFTRETYRTYF